MQRKKGVSPWWCVLNPSLEAKQESWAQSIGELNSLFPLHWEEVQYAMPLAMNYIAYRSLEAAGTLVLVTLRDDATLVGYWTCVLSPSLHSRSLRAASTDLVFIKKGSRAGGAFSILQRKMEEILLHHKVSLWFTGEKLANPIGPALLRAGFSPEERIFLKRLGE